MSVDAVIVYVLRTGGDFRPEHVHGLQAEVARANPQLHALHVCLTDAHGFAWPPDWTPRHPTLTLGLPVDWRGWWATMSFWGVPEMLAGTIDMPEHLPFVYLDLDTSVLGSLEPLLAACPHSDRVYALPDIYHPSRAECGVLVCRDRMAMTAMWQDAVKNGAAFRDRDKTPGDWLRAQSAAPVELFNRWSAGVWSYKRDIRDADKMGHNVPNIVVFHGRPRPWHVGGTQGVRAMIARKTPTQAEQERTDAP